MKRFIHSICILACALGLLATTGCQSGVDAQVLSPDAQLALANKSVVQRYYTEVWNQRSLGSLNQIFAADLQDHQCLADQAPGLHGFHQVIEAVQSGYGNTQFTLDEIIAERDMVSTRFTFSATFMANGYDISFTGHETWRLENGRIAERWGTLDFLSLMSQVFATAGPIGTLPTPTNYRPTDADTFAVRAYYEDIWNKAQDGLFHTFFEDTFVDNSPDPGQTPDLTGFMQSVAGFRDGFHNSQLSVDQLTIEGDKIRVHWTYNGEFPGNNSPVSFTGIDVWLSRGGRIQQRWGEYDLQTFVDQVGLIASPPVDPTINPTDPANPTINPIGIPSTSPQRSPSRTTKQAPTRISGSASREFGQSTVRRYYDEVWNLDQPGVIEKLFAADFVDHSPDDGQSPDLKGFKKSVADFRSSFRDPRFIVNRMVEDEDKVVVDWTFQAAFSPLRIPVEFTGNEVWRIRDGKIAERWAEYDSETLERQLSR